MESNYNTDQARPFRDCYLSFLEAQTYTDIPPAFLSSGKQISVFIRNEAIGKGKVSRDKTLKSCDCFLQRRVYYKLKQSRNDMCH